MEPKESIRNMKRVELTRNATEALADILQWTLDNFGLVQSEKYRKELMERIAKLAAGEPPSGRPLHYLIGKVPEASDLLYYKVGRHLIIYRETPDSIAVGDFIHVVRDIEVNFRNGAL